MSEIKDIRAGTALLSNLHVRYIPVVTPIELWKFDMSLITSPHVELMKIFAKYGLDWERIYKSDYYTERDHRFRIGMKKWTKAHIIDHIKRRYSIFKSMKKNGIVKKYLKADPVRVLENPFWQTRFGYIDHWLGGQEIWNGAGRCAAAFVLGYWKIPVLWCKDMYSSSRKKGKFASKLKNVKGVFDD